MGIFFITAVAAAFNLFAISDRSPRIDEAAVTQEIVVDHLAVNFESDDEVAGASDRAGLARVRPMDLAPHFDAADVALPAVAASPFGSDRTDASEVAEQLQDTVR